MNRGDMTIKSRLNLKIEADLKDWVMDYARRHGTNVTKLICVYLVHLRQEEEKVDEEYVEQI